MNEIAFEERERKLSKDFFFFHVILFSFTKYPHKKNQPKQITYWFWVEFWFECTIFEFELSL